MRAELLLLAIVLAGCSQAPAPADAPSIGGLEGVVVDETLRPMEGALVAVGNQTTLVGDDGRYRLALPGGSITVHVQHEGYESVTRNVDLIGGAWTPLNVTLRAVHDDRYHDTQVFRGIIECGIIVQLEHSHGNSDPDDDDRIMCPGVEGRDHYFPYVPDKNPQDLLLELFWRANNQHAEVLTLVLRDVNGDVIHFVEGPSPLRLELAAAVTQLVFGEDGTANIEVLTGIPEQAVGDVFVGFHFDQEFDLYATSFHGMDQPIHWSVES